MDKQNMPITIEGVKQLFYTLDKQDRLEMISHYIDNLRCNQRGIDELTTIFTMERNLTFRTEKDSNYYLMLEHAKDKFDLLIGEKKKSNIAMRFDDLKSYFEDALSSGKS